MANKNLNTLNVKTLNYTGDYIYHRGVPVEIGGAGSSYWASSGTDIYNTNAGRVGIGTTGPTETLDVSGNTRLRGLLRDISNNSGNPGNILQATTTGIKWVHPQDATGVWSDGSLDQIFYNKGNVGIGTANPFTTLDVSGVLTVHDGTIDMSGTNTAMGCGALNTNTTGSDNTAVGSEALHDNSSGYCNTATGYKALWKNILGYGNVAIGCNTLNENTSGNSNTAIGYLAGENQGVDWDNTINIGYDTSCNANDTACIGNSDISCVYFGSTSGNARLDCSGINTTGIIFQQPATVHDLSNGSTLTITAEQLVGGVYMELPSSSLVTGTFNTNLPTYDSLSNELEQRGLTLSPGFTFTPLRCTNLKTVNSATYIAFNPGTGNTLVDAGSTLGGQAGCSLLYICNAAGDGFNILIIQELTAKLAAMEARLTAAGL